MNIAFHITYCTHWGEQLYLCGSVPELGIQNPKNALLMEPDGKDRWSVTVTFKRSHAFTYFYLVVCNGEVTRTEWGNHKVPVFTAARVSLTDRWLERPPLQPFYSSAFTKAIFAHTAICSQVTPHKTLVTLTCNAPTVRKGEVLAICGGTEALGNWNPEKAIPLNPIHQPDWSLSLAKDTLPPVCEFRFVLLDEVTHKLLAWELGNNRQLSIADSQPADVLYFSDYVFRDPQPLWRCAGVAVPVFSLRSQQSEGIGEFNDLPLLVDWAVKTGQSIIQILPINDTTMSRTWTDSYPYNANSSFALNPIYIHLESVGKLKDPLAALQFGQQWEALNALPQVDYAKVLETKWSYLRQIYQEEGKKTLSSAAFKAFFSQNEFWLKPYAVYCFFRDRYGTADFHRWEGNNYTKVEPLCHENAKEYKEVALHFFIQYHLHVQLKKAVEYAHQKGIVLKGDIPIGISNYSVDAWSNGHLFCMDCQAGAPPDDFAVEGQNWGFPTYNWNEMAKDHYAWFQKRFRKMSEYFDAYRIDHLLGFFRIWEIPTHAVQGLLGHFNPALPLSPDDMRDFGFTFQLERHAQPFITYDIVRAVFEEITPIVIAQYLQEKSNGVYILLPQYSTQRQVEAAFAGKEKEEELFIRNGLYQLIANVLFVEEPSCPGMYHPRISAFSTYTYRTMTEPQKKAYTQLYNHFFYHRHNDFWKTEALKKLPVLIDSTSMLVCGEDLGMIPACVPDVMNELRILSLEIQRMPKEASVRFGNPASYPYYSVCTTSTHDMSGLRGWWEEDRETTQLYYRDILHQQGLAPFYCEPWICRTIVQQHLQSPAMLTILPLQDWLSIDGGLRYQNPQEERINVPADSRHYWRYRMHLTLETLLECNTFNQQVLQLIKQSGR